MRENVEGPAILPGYPYRLRLASESPLFLQGAQFYAQVRQSTSAGEILAEIASQSGGFERRRDTEIELVLSPAQTAALPLGHVVLDLIRTDLDPPQHLGIFLELPVLQPVTRSSAS